jgi:HAE1 family hydrophobic/amphiphilic exporter-1
MYVNVTLAPAASLERTDVAARKVEAVLKRTEGIRNFNAVIGFSLLNRVTASYSAFFFVQLEPWDERGSDELVAKAIRDKVNRALAAEVPEATATAYLPPSIPGMGTSGGFSLWLQDRSGGTVEFLDENVKKFIAAARKRPELTGVNSSFSAAVPQVFADVDRDKALVQGVQLGDVYQTLQANLGGIFVNQFNRFGRQWRVFLGAEGEYRTSEDNIGQFYVRNSTGQMVPLSTVTTTRRISGPEYTNRFNLYRAAQVIGSAAPGYSSGQAMAALEEVAAETLPREMGYDWDGLSYQEKRASGTTLVVFGLSLLFVFLILAALYESWSLPFSVLLSVPIAVFGAFAGLYLRRYNLDVFAQIGLVMLIGLAAKNAILIVEFARDELQQGRDLVGAALEGARRRLRPILMTSFAFILGCVPLWIASGSGAQARRILGTVVITGMLAATLLAIFVIPLLFVVVERIAGGKALRNRQAPPTARVSDGAGPERR